MTNKITEQWRKKRTSLSLKLLLTTWAVSSLATLLLTAVQLTLDYKRDLDKLHNNFAIIQNTYLDSMAEHLWSYDTRLLEIQMDGMSRLSGISYLHLMADDKTIYKHGLSNPAEQSHKQFTIKHKSTSEVLGQLDVEIDVQSLRANYFKEAFLIFVRQAAKTLVVVFVLYYFFNKILVVHIMHIADYLKAMGRVRNDDLQLNRPKQGADDELDTLVASINLFRSELMNANKKLEELNSALEHKVIERTQQLTTKNESLEKAMQEIKRMQATLIAQERLASLGNLTASVAHEIRNPLNFVLNFSELLNETDDTTEVRTLSKVILKHSHRIDQIVRSMQILSGWESDVLKITNINDLVRHAYAEVLKAHSITENYTTPTVTFNFTEPLDIPVYPASLSRALYNIIDNSLNSIEGKEDLNPNFLPEIVLASKINDNTVEISVRDNGLGISPTLGEKIFEPFLSTKSSGQGAGLGLTVAVNIAQKHGGTLRYKSDFGQWTEFTLSLPITKEDRT